MPEATENRSGEGHARWQIKEKSFAWERPLRRADLKALGSSAPTGPILGVLTEDLEMKEALLSADPRAFFTTPHFDGYPAVLVRLKSIAKRKLESVIRDAWLARAPKRMADAYLRERHPEVARSPMGKRPRRHES